MTRSSTHFVSDQLVFELAPRLFNLILYNFQKTSEKYFDSRSFYCCASNRSVGNKKKEEINVHRAIEAIWILKKKKKLLLVSNNDAGNQPDSLPLLGVILDSFKKVRLSLFDCLNAFRNEIQSTQIFPALNFKVPTSETILLLFFFPFKFFSLCVCVPSSSHPQVVNVDTSATIFTTHLHTKMNFTSIASGWWHSKSITQ